MNMPEWKKNIFVRAVQSRMEVEDKTIDEILNSYVSLTENEKTEITETIMKLGD